MNSAFSPEEAEALVRGIPTAATIEPLDPSRSELLACFYDALPDLSPQREEGDWVGMSAAFNQLLIPRLYGVRFQQELRIKGARSFFTEEKGVVLDGEKDITGKFGGFCVESWFNVPFSEAACDDPEPFRVDVGLHLMLDEATIQWTTDLEEIGEVLVPLDHGTPELYKVLRMAS